MNGNSLVVVKVGGGEGIDLEAVCADVAAWVTKGRRFLLVHGGSHATNEAATALGHPPRFITSPSGFTSRLTDRRTLEIMEMVYCGQINKGIVERLQGAGVNAIGLCGLDGGLWRGPRKQTVRALVGENGRSRLIRDNLTGKVEAVNISLLHSLLDNGYLPVLTAPALSYRGEAINVDGDRAAAATAVALAATHLLILSNVPGLLRHFPDETSLIPAVAAHELETVGQRYAQGRMHIKLLAAREALAGGVGQVTLGDARSRQPLTRTLAGQGTVIQGERV
jgi:[amino group carrier protein]-L-2-aminoadipate 6-kinase